MSLDAERASSGAGGNGRQADSGPRLTKDDVRELEARVNARFQAVSARFVRVDNRFVGTDSRLDETERRHHALAQRFDTRFQVVDARLDSTTSQVEDVRVQIDAVRRQSDQLRATVRGFVVPAVTAYLALVVMTIVLIVTWR